MDTLDSLKIRAWVDQKTPLREQEGRSEKLSHLYLISDLYPEYVKNFYKSIIIIKKPTRQLVLKRGQKT